MNTPERTDTTGWGPVTDWNRPEDIRTRDGRTVEIRFSDGRGIYPVVGYIYDEQTEKSWTFAGIYRYEYKTNYDLVQRPPYSVPRHIPGFRPLEDGEAWRMPEKFRREDLLSGERPLLVGEEVGFYDFKKMEGSCMPDLWMFTVTERDGQIWSNYKTTRPLPPLPEPVKEPHEPTVLEVVQGIVETVPKHEPVKEPKTQSIFVHYIHEGQTLVVDCNNERLGSIIVHHENRRAIDAIFQALTLTHSASAETPNVQAEAHASSPPAGGVTAGDAKPRIPLGPEDVPPGSAVRINNGTRMLITRWNEYGVTINNCESSWEQLMEDDWRILRPGSSEWEQCWKEGKP